MSMEYWEQAQRRRGNIAGAELAYVLREQFGDEPLPSNQSLTETESHTKAEAPMNAESLLLKSVVVEYKSRPHTPELVTKFWKIFLESNIKQQNLDISIADIACDRTQEELEVLNKDGRMWIPEVKLSYPQLGRIFPKMESHTVRGGSRIKDEFEQDAKGVDVELSIDSPNRNTNEKDLEELFKSQGREGIRLSTFILASQASKVLTGKYFDEGVTWSRLLGSRFGDYVVLAHFRSDGYLSVYWPMVSGRDPSFGGRSEGVKKA